MLVLVEVSNCTLAFLDTVEFSQASHGNRGFRHHDSLAVRQKLHTHRKVELLFWNN